MPVRTDLGPRSRYLAGSHVSNRCAGSITWSSTEMMRGSSATQGTRFTQGLDPHVVIPEHLGEHDVGVLADGRRLLREWKLVADNLDRCRQLIGAQPLLGDPLE